MKEDQNPLMTRIIGKGGEKDRDTTLVLPRQRHKDRQIPHEHKSKQRTKKKGKK